MIKVGITNRELCKDFYDQISKIAKSKLDYLIIREKDLGEEELLNLVLMVRERLKYTNIKIIINSNIDVARKVDADGVHLSFNNFIAVANSIEQCSKKLANQKVDNFEAKGNNYKIYKLIGVSIHSYEEGLRAYELGADYVIYGHVFQTDCKKGLEPRGLREIDALAKKIDIPIIGIGGIGEDNYKEVLGAGAKGVALMSTLMMSENPEELINTIS
ncbi:MULTISPECIES: thiamine phosphate synthase [unclassified Clostridium]|uniref:thiamine phosphate synthase n=1 Tax=unclassified Clostridium TaxID=2614128 RepID=UPI000297F550|nr:MULTISPECIES: thiamine phosphate synthase [unclassified Clostridium]EKQ55398.1 MAG: thiamine monophosphate synthase [Clostridium sp. Maddingley MBC34-26]